MARPIAGISIALIVYALLAGLLPLLVQLLILPVEAEAEAIAALFWIGALLIGAHYDAPRDPDKTAALEAPYASARAAAALAAAAGLCLSLLYWGALGGPFAGGDWTMIGRIGAMDAADGFAAKLRIVLSPLPGEDYRGPVDQITWYVQHAIWGLDPVPYRLFNFAVHVSNAVLLLRLAARILRGRWSAMIVAALFALTPLAVEQVAWISGRSELLGVFFLLATLNAYDRYRATDGAGWYAAAIALFAVGVLSNELVSFLPLVMLGAEWVGFYEGDSLGRTHRVRWRALAPFAAVSVAFVGVWAATGGIAAGVDLAKAVDFVAVRVPAQLFVPIYPDVGPFDPIDKMSLAGLVLMAVLLSGVTSRGEARSVLLSLLLIVVGAAAPLVFGTEKSVLEGWRPLYIPALGFSLLLGQALTAPPESRRRRRAAKSAWVSVLIVASFWGIAINLGPWKTLFAECAAFEQQALAQLRAAGPSDTVFFAGFPASRSVHVPGFRDRYPPPTLLAGRLRDEGSEALPAIGVLRADRLRSLHDPTPKVYDWRTLDWGSDAHLLLWDGGDRRLVRLDALLRTRQALALAAPDRPETPAAPPPAVSVQRWRRHYDSKRADVVRWRLQADTGKGWDPAAFGTLTIRGRPKKADAGLSNLIVTVSWAAASLATTPDVRPLRRFELPLGPEGTERTWRLDLLASITWAISDAVTSLVVETDGPVHVQQVRLTPTAPTAP